jgi:hypothetical protein
VTIEKRKLRHKVVDRQPCIKRCLHARDPLASVNQISAAVLPASRMQ